jgi:hypothetical protein
MRYTLKRSHWRVPTEAHAFDGWLEGVPTPDQRAERLAQVALQRQTWVPSEEAWNQLRDLERFIGREVCIEFWDSIKFFHEDEGPYPILADCKGIVLLRDEGFLQPYMIVDQIKELPNSLGYPPTSFLDSGKITGLTLGSIAELYEVTTLG